MGSEVVEIPWIGGVLARTIGIGKIVEHCVQGKVVEVGKRKAWTSVKKIVGRKVIEVDAAVSVIGLSKILKAHVEVIDKVRVVHDNEVSVVAKGRAVSELEIVPVVAKRDLARKESGMGRAGCQGTGPVAIGQQGRKRPSCCVGFLNHAGDLIVIAYRNRTVLGQCMVRQQRQCGQNEEDKNS